jgi:hypothetical protein
VRIQVFLLLLLSFSLIIPSFGSILNSTQKTKNNTYDLQYDVYPYSVSFDAFAFIEQSRNEIVNSNPTIGDKPTSIVASDFNNDKNQMICTLWIKSLNAIF